MPEFLRMSSALLLRGQMPKIRCISNRAFSASSTSVVFIPPQTQRLWHNPSHRPWANQTNQKVSDFKDSHDVLLWYKIGALNRYKKDERLHYNMQVDSHQSHHAEDVITSLNLDGGPNVVENLVYDLQKCRKRKQLAYAKHALARICSNGLQGHKIIENYIVPMLVECGSVPHAQQAFDRLICPSEHSWTSLILGYTECGYAQYALNLFQSMKDDNVNPSGFTFGALLRACSKLQDVQKGREIHYQIIQSGLERDSYVGNSLVEMYAKCGSLVEARKTFDELSVKDAFSWNALMAGYADSGLTEEVLNCYDEMQLDNNSPNAITFLYIVKACATIGAMNKGREIHAQIIEQGFGRDLFIGSSMVDMYIKCGSLAEAVEVFNELPIQDEIAWNALIAGYIDYGLCQEALKCLEQMRKSIYEDEVTFVLALRACSGTRDIDKGRETHMKIVRRGFGNNIYIASTLVDMYAKCGFLAEAREVFDKLPTRDVILWNALISGYAENGLGKEAIKCYEEMQLSDIYPDAITFLSILKVCSEMGALSKGREIHVEVLQKELVRDLFVGSALVDMYAKCGSLAEAEDVFDKLPVQNVISWTALAAGYAEGGFAHEALACFQHMQLEGMTPDAITLVSCLKACGNIGAIEKSRQMHKKIVQIGFQEDLLIGTTLIDIYTKCGSLEEARKVFDMLPVHTVVSWNALILGYGINQKGIMAVKCFEEMQEAGVRPDGITFTCLLTACSRTSLVLLGQELFNLMSEHGISPTIDHYTCMVDLLARAGYLYDAENLMKNAPGSLHKESWTALLSACRIFGEVEVGHRCFQQLVQLTPTSAHPYALMENIYAGSGRWDDANKVKELRRHAGVKKKRASALIEVNNKVHEFVVGDVQSLEISEVLASLLSRMKKEGYVPNLDLVLRPISNEEKEDSLCGHAEKMAIAFGLLHTPQGQTLHLTKNLRMCNDCHDATKAISKFERREIILRESNWVHHFKDGLCSCGDMW